MWTKIIKVKLQHFKNVNCENQVTFWLKYLLSLSLILSPTNSHSSFEYLKLVPFPDIYVIYVARPSQ